MTTCRDIEPKLGELADGTLAPDARAQRDQVETHLTGCAHCRGVLRDLERLRRAAGGLGPITPPDHVWMEIAGQIHPAAGRGGEPPRATDRRAALRQWIGLAATLVLVTLGAYFLTVLRAPAPASGNAAATPSVQALTEELTKATEHYENAIGQLEKLTKDGNASIDPTLAATLQKNIATIDTAIADSRTALGQDPTNAPARESLFEALKSKVGVLQATLNLMNEIRKGDQAAAANAAAAFGKKS
jgi:hypothetical protein